MRNIEPEELLPDNTELVTFTIPGRPATKKTHQNVVFIKGRPRILPSKQYAAFEKACKESCVKAWKSKGKKPMDFGVGIQMQIYLNNWIVGDHNGYMQAIGDILQKWEIIADDSWIMWLSNDQHWLAGIDKDNPRVEITIVRRKHPKEDYREIKEEKEEKSAKRKTTAKPKTTRTTKPRVTKAKK